jgi:hypothetical protein
MDPILSQTIPVHFLIIQSLTNDGNISSPPTMVSFSLKFCMHFPGLPCVVHDSITSRSFIIPRIIDTDQAHKLLQTTQQQNLPPPFPYVLKILALFSLHYVMRLISLKLPFSKVEPKIGPMRRMNNGFNPKRPHGS